MEAHVLLKDNTPYHVCVGDRANAYRKEEELRTKNPEPAGVFRAYRIVTVPVTLDA